MRPFLSDQTFFVRPRRRGLTTSSRASYRRRVFSNPRRRVTETVGPVGRGLLVCEPEEQGFRPHTVFDEAVRDEILAANTSKTADAVINSRSRTTGLFFVRRIRADLVTRRSHSIRLFGRADRI